MSSSEREAAYNTLIEHYRQAMEFWQDQYRKECAQSRHWFAMYMKEANRGVTNVTDS